MDIEDFNEHVSPDLQRGDIVGEYWLMEHLGSGGFATVWKALRRGSEDDHVAIKQFFVPGGDVSGTSEFQALKDLESVPGLPRVRGYGRIKGDACYLAMSLVTGATIARLVSRGEGPDSVGNAFAVATRLAQIVKQVHDQSWLHCDITARNVFMKGDEVYLIDFGTARKASSKNGPNGAASDAYVPEVQLGGSHTKASDVYQWGLVAFLLCVGSPGHELSVAERKKALRAIPRRAARVIARALEFDVDRRFQDGSQLHKACTGRRWVVGLAAVAFLGVAIGAQSVLGFVRDSQGSGGLGGVSPLGPDQQPIPRAPLWDGSQDSVPTLPPIQTLVIQGTPGGCFGQSVAANRHGDIFVGAYRNSETGSAFLFRKKSVKGKTLWYQDSVVNGPNRGDWMGYRVAANDKMFVAGCMQYESRLPGLVAVLVNRGKSVKRAVPDINGDRSLTKGIGSTSFGAQVALGGRNVFVVNSHTNDLFVFTASRSGKLLQKPEVVIRPKQSRAVETMGQHGLYGDNKVIYVHSAVQDSENKSPEIDLVYVYRKLSGGWEKMPSQILGSPGHFGDYFGRALDASDELLVVAAPRFDNNRKDGNISNDGIVYVYSRRRGSGKVDPKPRWTISLANQSRGEWFGYSVSLDGDTLLVGARDSKQIAYVFRLVGKGKSATWKFVARLSVEEPGSGFYGYSVDLVDGLAVVGAPGAGSGPGVGEVHVFDISKLQK